MHPLTTTQDLTALLRATLRIARTLVENGRRVDLTGLDRQIGLACAKALDLPPEQGRTLRPLLVQLLEETDRLARALPAFH
jgi:hypothetical protein